MCHSSESAEGRTHPAPRNPGKCLASDVPASTHASISALWAGSTWRVTETVTGLPIRRSSHHHPVHQSPVVPSEMAPSCALEGPFRWGLSRRGLVAGGEGGPAGRLDRGRVDRLDDRVVRAGPAPRHHRVDGVLLALDV